MPSFVIISGWILYINSAFRDLIAPKQNLNDHKIQSSPTFVKH